MRIRKYGYSFLAMSLVTIGLIHLGSVDVSAVAPEGVLKQAFHVRW